jgi:hypothetical protein
VTAIKGKFLDAGTRDLNDVDPLLVPGAGDVLRFNGTLYEPAPAGQALDRALSVRTSNLTTTSSFYQDYTNATLTVTAPTPNRYQIDFGVVWRLNDSGTQWRYRLSLDGVGTVDEEFRITSWDDSRNNRFPSSFRYFVDDLAAGSQTFRLQVRSNDSKLLRIWHGYIQVKRIA